MKFNKVFPFYLFIGINKINKKLIKTNKLGIVSKFSFLIL